MKFQFIIFLQRLLVPLLRLYLGLTTLILAVKSNNENRNTPELYICIIHHVTYFK